jgi:hypothetical protein
LPDLEHHQLPQVVERTEPVESVTMVALVTADELELVQRVPDEVGHAVELESGGG